MRRLPVYLLLDCSGSMSGEPIESVRHGIKALLSDLRSDPLSIETAYLSVITFNSSAEQICPLTELMNFKEPQLSASGTTALGEALTVLEDAMDREVKKSTPTQKGDWRPLVFLMTDGMPTDSWEKPAERIKQKRPANIIACAAGPDADSSILKHITETVVLLNNLQPDTLREFFRWVSSSIKVTSVSVAQKADVPINLPPPPPQIVILP